MSKGFNEATRELAEKGLKVSENVVKENSSKAKDIVLSTDPLPGVEVSEGTAVILTVSSGEAKEKSLKINVDLPAEVNRELSMKVYINGVMDPSNSKTIIPAYNSNYYFSIKGTSESKTVIVNLDNQKYRVYEVNFSNETVKLAEKYSFNDTSASDTSIKNAEKSKNRIVENRRATKNTKYSLTETKPKVNTR